MDSVSPPSAASRDAASRWTRRFLWLVAGLFIGRLLLLAVSPLNLSGDEAYYWDWGRQLAWGYYSKPPLIGWWMGFAGWLGGDSTFGIRFWALVFGSGTLLWLFLLGRDLFGARAAFWAALACALSPANAALNQILTIDPPLVFAWTLSLWAAWRLFSGESWSWRWGLTLALGLGLGVLSKQMMLLFPVIASIYLMLEPTHRRWLRHPGWWLVAASSLLFLLPPLYWNYRHDWITFVHTGGNLSSPPVSLGKQVGRFFEFLGAQLGLLGPIVYGLLLLVLWRAARAWRELSPAERFLFLFSAPALVVFFLVAARQRALPNWPAVYYPAACLLLGGWVAGQLSFAAHWPAPRRWVRWGVALGGGLMALLYLLIFVSPLLPLQRDPLERVRGWDQYGKAIAAAEAEHFGDDEERFYLVAGHRYFASQLAFHHPEQPRVYRWAPGETIHSQYEIWPGPETAEPDSALIVVPGGRAEFPERLRGHFTSLTFLVEIDIPITRHSHRRIALYRGDGGYVPVPL